MRLTRPKPVLVVSVLTLAAILASSPSSAQQPTARLKERISAATFERCGLHKLSSRPSSIAVPRTNRPLAHAQLHPACP
jgi:hypothetical protein